MTKACLIYYNDAPFLPMMLKSIEGKVDTLLAVDGRFKHYPGSEVLSTDGSTELIEAAGGTVIAEGFWKTEMQKRQVYLDHLKNGDLMFIIDADEILQGVLPSYSAVIPLYAFRSVLLEYWYLRVLRKTSGMEYAEAHWNIVDETRNWFAEVRQGRVPKWHGARLIHLHFLRSEAQKQAKWMFSMLRPDPILMVGIGE